MKFLLLEFAFMLVVVTKVSSAVEHPDMAPLYPPQILTPPIMTPLPLAPTIDPNMPGPSQPMPLPFAPTIVPVAAPTIAPNMPGPSQQKPLPFAPTITPIAAPTLPIPLPHDPIHCAMGCVDYCKMEPTLTRKIICRNICSICCFKCDGCIPMYGRRCASWDRIVFRGVPHMCP